LALRFLRSNKGGVDINAHGRCVERRRESPAVEDEEAIATLLDNDRDRGQSVIPAHAWNIRMLARKETPETTAIQRNF
jgi:hypothetical protein